MISHLLFLILVGFNYVSAGIHPHFLKYRDGLRYLLHQHDNGKLEIVDSLEYDPNERFIAEKDVRFLLYTRSNPTTPYVLIGLDDASLSDSYFSHKKDTKIISHGWTDNGNSELNIVIRDAFLGQMDVNVICVDWGKGSNGLYGTAVNNVPRVATWVANVIDWLISKGSETSRFHIIGYSLGGHVAGQTARFVNGNIPYLTALDPAGLSWGPESERIRPTDAEYVEVIHTDSGYMGIKEPVGHNDFYPNEGVGMPGCLPINIGCSHARAFQYFAESIDNTYFMAKQCSNLDEALNNECSNLTQLHMGGAKAKAKYGIFHLKTTSTKPYYIE